MAEVAGYLGYSAQDFERVMRTTLADHIRTEEAAHLRNFQFGALLMANGRVSYNHGGRGFDWPVRMRLHPVEGNTGETPRTWVRENLHKTANLEYRGYQATDMIYERELEENKDSETAIVRVYDQFIDRLMESMRETLARQYWIDGTLAANAELWHGLESMFSLNGTVDSTQAGAVQRAANAADFVGYPTGEYAGLQMDLANYGGANESGETWPDGLADPEFDFWTPIVVNYTSTGFNGATATWADQNEEAMRYAIINAQRSAGVTEQLTNVWLARDLYRLLMQTQDGRQDIMVESNYQSLRALGFKSVVMFDGLEVSWEASVPTSVDYGLGFENCELRCMYSEMLRADGPEYDINTQSYKAAVKTLSNLKFKSPRNFFKLAALA